MIQIREAQGDRRVYMPLLLLADEQQDMVERYLHRGVMFILWCDREARAECLVTDEGEGIIEIKNIAVAPAWQGRGYGRMLIEHVANTYGGQYAVLQVGTGDSPLTIPFYEKCGFTRHHVLKGFFTDNYDHAIYECGKQLIDMVFLRRPL